MEGIDDEPVCDSIDYLKRATLERGDIDAPDGEMGVAFGGVFRSEISRDVGGTGPIEKSGGSAEMLHKREPFQIVILRWQDCIVVVCAALERRQKESARPKDGSGPGRIFPGMSATATRYSTGRDGRSRVRATRQERRVPGECAPAQSSCGAA